MAHKVKKWHTNKHKTTTLDFMFVSGINKEKNTKNPIIICFRHLTNDSRRHFSFAIYSEHINSAFVLKNQRFSITSFLILNHSVGLKLCATNARLSFRKWVGRGANFVQLSTRFSLGFY